MYDYIPKKDSALLLWVANFVNVVSANATDWNISSEEVSGLSDARTNFADLLGQAESPLRNKVIVAQKNAARSALISGIRALVNFKLRNPVITDAQRLAMGLHVRDTTPTSVPVPTTRPELNIDVLDARRLKLLFRDMGSESKAKPYGVNGAVVVYDVLDTPPTSINSLVRNVLATRTPYVLEFDESERGKRVYFAICWQNKKGKRGPWSEIESAVVP
jgi:hypothetical protein